MTSYSLTFKAGMVGGLYRTTTTMQGFKRTSKNESLLHKFPFNALLLKNVNKYSYRHFNHWKFKVWNFVPPKLCEESVRGALVVCTHARLDCALIACDSYDLRVPRDNLARPTPGSQLSVHKQSSSSVH